MIGRLVIPVIDTENGKYETNIKLTRDEYSNMVYDNFKKNDAAIDRYMAYGRDSYNSYGGFIQNIEDISELDVLYSDSECECAFLDAKKNDINEEYLLNYFDNGKMLLLLFNINPNSMEPDAQTELRFWIDDSRRVLEDSEIDDTAKLKILPLKTFGIYIGDEKYILNNCKLIENRSDDKFPYYFATIIEKITK